MPERGRAVVAISDLCTEAETLRELMQHVEALQAQARHELKQHDDTTPGLHVCQESTQLQVRPQSCILQGSSRLPAPIGKLGNTENRFLNCHNRDGKIQICQRQHLSAGIEALTTGAARAGAPWGPRRQRPEL